jgi:hypothetical protein
MRRHTWYLFLAGFSLCAGLVTLAAGNSQVTAILELLLAILCAVLSFRSHVDD